MNTWLKMVASPDLRRCLVCGWRLQPAEGRPGCGRDFPVGTLYCPVCQVVFVRHGNKFVSIDVRFRVPTIKFP